MEQSVTSGTQFLSAERALRQDREKAARLGFSPGQPPCPPGMSQRSLQASLGQVCRPPFTCDLKTISLAGENLAGFVKGYVFHVSLFAFGNPSTDGVELFSFHHRLLSPPEQGSLLRGNIPFLISAFRDGLHNSCHCLPTLTRCGLLSIYLNTAPALGGTRRHLLEPDSLALSIRAELVFSI